MSHESRPLSYYEEGGFVMARVNDPNTIGSQVNIDTRAIDFLIHNGVDFSVVEHGNSDYIPVDLFSYATMHGFEDEALAFADGFENFGLSKSFEGMSVDELDTELSGKLDIFYRVVQKSLDNGWIFGFHRHDKEHSNVVTDRILGAVRQLGYGVDRVDIEKLAVVCGRMHDLGQIFSRKEHPEFSVRIMKKLIGDSLSGEQMGLIEDAIANHEQRTARNIFDQEVEECDGDFGKAYENLRNKNPLLWALVLADKSDIGRDRVSKKALTRYSEAVREDRYIRKDALVEREELVGNEHSIVFNRGVFRDEFGERMTFAEWRSLLFDLHGNRFALSATSHFVLNPKSDSFVVNLINGEGSNEPRRIVFNRNENPFETVEREVKNIENADIKDKCMIFEAFGKNIASEVLDQEVGSEIDCQVEHFASGAFSSIYRVEMMGSEVPTFVVKTMSHRPDVPFDDIGEYFSHLKKDSRHLPGLVRNYGVYGLNSDSEIVNLNEVDVLPDGVSLVFAVQEAMPQNAVQMLTVLNGLGLSTIQDGRVHETSMDSQIEIPLTYGRIIEKLVEIHNLESEESDVEYRSSLLAIVEDDTRFDGVASSLEGVRVVLEKKDLDLLRRKMIELVDKYSNSYGGRRLKYVHGDAWASNFFVNEDEVLIIDPGNVERSDSALDVVFATADIAFIGVNGQKEIPGKNSDYYSYLEYADQLVDRYIELSGDRDVRKTMALFFGFKGFVSAVFDAGENNVQRNDLVAACIGATDLATRDEDFEFQFCDLKGYSDHGKELMSK